MVQVSAIVSNIRSVIRENIENRAESHRLCLAQENFINSPKVHTSVSSPSQVSQTCSSLLHSLSAKLTIN